MATTAYDPDAAAEEMRTFLYLILAVLIVLMVGVTKAVNTADSQGQGVTDGAAFQQFQRSYVFVYCWMVAGDWLQGPYVYALYEHYGYGIADIGVLFIAGFGSSMLFGTFVGSACDRAGRKNGCLGYALIYSASCVTKHSPNYWVLMFGRLLGGIATSLLFSAFEAWMVTEHKRQNFSDAALGQTFSRATLLNGVVAVSSGFVGQWARDVAGPVAPFDTAIVAMAIGGAVVAKTWPENYGEASNGGSSVADSIRTAVKQCKDDPTIIAACMLQSFYEAAMYTFVFMWTPAMEARTTVPPAKIPFGLIFASFMVSMMLGSCCFNYLCQQKWRAEAMMTLVLGVGIVSMATVLVTGNPYICLFGFCAFEATCGIYFPAMGTLRGEYLPDDTRSTIMNLARVPLNAIVCITLVYVGELPQNVVFALIMGWLMLALATLKALRKAPAASFAAGGGAAGTTTAGN